MKHSAPVSLFFLTRNLKSMSFLRDKWASVLNHFRRRVVDGLINCHLRALGLFYKQRPVPLKYWQFFYLPLAILSGCSDPLFPNPDRLRTSGKSLSIRPLKELLRHDLLGDMVSRRRYHHFFVAGNSGGSAEDHYRMWSRSEYSIASEGSSGQSVSDKEFCFAAFT